jgi:hypothetical protein
MAKSKEYKITAGYLNRRLGLRLRKMWWHFTARRRALPDFIIIGVEKGGTTSLDRYLRQHPQIVRSFKKEVKYFDCNYSRGLNWYRSFFPHADEVQSQYRLTGEASPSYIVHPLAPQRIKDLLPGVKLIALLRNPVERAYSHYKANVRKGYEQLPFLQALAAEEQRLGDIPQQIARGEEPELFNFLHYSYKLKGQYADQLPAWQQAFPADQLLILRSEDLFEDTTGVFKKTLDFLGLEPYDQADLQVFNQGKYSSIDPQAREITARFFQPYNQRLEQMLGRPLSWD